MKLLHRIAPLFIIGLLVVPNIIFAQTSIYYRDEERNNKLIFTLNPGESFAGEVTIENRSDNNLEVLVYATDGTKTNSGTFTAKSNTENQSNIGEWMKTPEEIIPLEAREKKQIPFEISIPSSITPGGYAGGISIEKLNEDTGARSAGAGAVTSTRVLLPVFIEIPGEKIREYNWGQFFHTFKKNDTFNFQFSNTGNTVLKVNGDILIKDRLSSQEYTVPLNDITLLQGDEIKSTASWKNPPFWGFFEATANIELYELDVQTSDFSSFDKQSRTITFSILPWQVQFGIPAIIVLIILFFVERKVRFTRLKKKSSEYTVKQGESLNSIAENYHVGWKTIARLNNIKPPYNVEAGQKILLPLQKKKNENTTPEK